MVSDFRYSDTIFLVELVIQQGNHFVNEIHCLSSTTAKVQKHEFDLNSVGL